MSLEFGKVVGQISRMADEIRSGQEEWGAHLNTAMGLANNPGLDADAFRARIGNSKVTWLVSEPQEALSARYPAPTVPADYRVVSVDGSSIDSDRHGPARCHLINLGTAALQYGSRPDADLNSVPTLYAGEDDLVVRDPGSAAEQFMNPQMVGIKRMVQEAGHLLERLKEEPSTLPTVGLLDGTLVPIALVGGGAPDYVRKKFLDEGLLPILDGFRELAEEQPVVLASYISRPGSSEVVNSLRVLSCPHSPHPDCDVHCSGSRPAIPGAKPA